MSALLLHRGGGSETVNLQALLYDGDMAQDLPMRGGDTLVLRAAKKLTIAGQVSDPRSVPIGEEIGILDAIALGGGLTALADLRAVRVIRSTGTEVVDISGLWDRGDITNNVRVGPGDSVIVPERLPEEVLVVGKVENPGPTDIYKKANRGVFGLVQAAVPLPEADLRKVTVHRVGAPPFLVDVKSIAEQGNFAGNYQAQGGDTIFVPELDKVYAIGAFSNSGAFPLTATTTVIEIVALAGLREDARIKQMRLVRPGTGGTQSQVINFNKVQKGLDNTNYALQAGDYVFVPSRDPNKSTFWDMFRDALFVLRVFT